MVFDILSVSLSLWYNVSVECVWIIRRVTVKPYKTHSYEQIFGKVFYTADMLFMALFIIAAVVVDIPWLTITTAIVLLLFGIAGVVYALLTRNGRPENYIYICALDAIIGLVAVIWGIVGGWWY